ncbi:MAG: CBS domain-containing protein [Cyclobacteriaceae bacterium]
MGSLDIKAVQTPEERKVLMDTLIQDIDALDLMIKEGLIESDIQRIGAEQEVCFVDKNVEPAPINTEVLERINDDHFTYEHASFNAEINVDPLLFSGDCLSLMESNLMEHLEHLEVTAGEFDSKIALVGILPTIGKEHLTPEYFTAQGRYKTINKLLNELRGKPYEFRIEGTDQLITRHDTTMFEGCNTSFQTHLQVSAEQFARSYNWSQAISGPVLAAVTNSPLLLGKRLWRETRIALFQQSLDTRTPTFSITEKAPRVTFGEHWIENSIIEIFKDDISRYPMLLYKESRENSLDELQQGKIPKLSALTIHNGTVYRWNRGCYGITEGKPHLRIECRYIPSGPTVLDEIANMAFWLGLMHGQPEDCYNLPEIMAFDDAKSNFVKAARMGLGAQFHWINHKRIPAKSLILEVLLPIAREGLQKAGISKKDIKKYLGVIEDRVRTEKTGSQWILDTYNELKKEETPPIAASNLTSLMMANQKKNMPVHTWEQGTSEDEIELSKELKVNQIMSRNLFTIQEKDPLKLASNMMAWKNIRHLPVEDQSGKLKGFLTTGVLLETLSKNADALAITDVMLKHPITIDPKDSIEHAIQIMTEHGIGGLPVVQDGFLVGIVTERDFMRITKNWLKQIKD